MYIAQQLGRYHLLDRVAFGGMAEIYRAKTFDSQGNQHIVAIKRVLSHLAEDDDFLQMLVDEAKIATLLDHPNIAKVYEFARWGDEYFIAMEYIDGKDLRSLVDRCVAQKVSIPIEHCAYVMVRILDALHAAHERTDGAGVGLNIIHRDVSPSNVIVSYDGQVKLCDFGIAKARLTRVQTRTGVIKGKVRYMSPEQALGRKLDRRTDIFSAGSVLYELLTQQPPFTAESEMELIFRVRDAKIVPPSRHNPEVPSAIERALRKAMTKSRSSRYQTAADFAADLRKYLCDAHPDYRPGRLGRFLRDLFIREIELELRRLEEFVVGSADPATLGDNLLAEVLGEGAAYTRFTPVDHSAMEDAKTRILARVPPPELRLPAAVDLHDLKTQIIDPDERERGIIKRKGRPRPGAHHRRDSKRATQVGTVQLDPQRDLDLHDAKTQILEIDPAQILSVYTDAAAPAAGVRRPDDGVAITGTIGRGPGAGDPGAAQPRGGASATSVVPDRVPEDDLTDPVTVNVDPDMLEPDPTDVQTEAFPVLPRRRSKLD